MKIKNVTFLDDNRFLKAKGEKLQKMTLKLPDGAIMTPMTKSGKIVGFSAVGPDGKAQDVMHMKIQMKKMPRGTPKKAKKPPVKQPVEPVCWYCRCTDISCVCVPTPCQDKK